MADHHSKIDTTMEKRNNKNIIDMYDEDIDIFSKKSKPRPTNTEEPLGKSNIEEPLDESNIKDPLDKSDTEVPPTKLDNEVQSKNLVVNNDPIIGDIQRNPTFHDGHISQTMTPTTRKVLENVTFADPDQHVHGPTLDDLPPKRTEPDPDFLGAGTDKDSTNVQFSSGSDESHHFHGPTLDDLSPKRTEPDPHQCGFYSVEDSPVEFISTIK